MYFHLSRKVLLIDRLGPFVSMKINSNTTWRNCFLWLHRTIFSAQFAETLFEYDSAINCTSFTTLPCGLTTYT